MCKLINLNYSIAYFYTDDQTFWYQKWLFKYRIIYCFWKSWRHLKRCFEFCPPKFQSLPLKQEYIVQEKPNVLKVISHFFQNFWDRPRGKFHVMDGIRFTGWGTLHSFCLALDECHVHRNKVTLLKITFTL